MKMMEAAAAHGTAELNVNQLARDIKQWGRELGFQAVGITDADLGEAEAHFLQWLADGFHGEMEYMARHGVKRSRPAELVPGAVRVISVRLDYRPDTAASDDTADDAAKAFIARYALGRDYHKVVRGKLQQLATGIEAAIGPFNYRVFSDSAPVMEVELARKAGLGWRGKHTLLINRDGGSWFFLGEIYTDLDLPTDAPEADHCGRCTSCIDVCPTGAIVAPYVVDARRCISYLTIELKGAIPEVFRPLLGNRIYGCDDCQTACPWNRFSQPTAEPDFAPRHGLDDAALLELFAWTEADFERNTAGSAIRRIGYEQWLRNIAVALGNAPTSAEITTALRARLEHPSGIVREHVAWALDRHTAPDALPTLQGNFP